MTSHRIYLASSWRNGVYPGVVEALRGEGLDVYDFRNPPVRPVEGRQGFKWEYLDPDYGQWTPQEFRRRLQGEVAQRQFRNDREALESCDTCVLVLPCGRSAHTEAGWFAGRGKRTIVYIPSDAEPTASDAAKAPVWEPELMYGLFDGIACSMEELIALLRLQKI